MLWSCLIFVWVVALTILSTDAAMTERKRHSTCREPTTVFQNFDMTRMLGHWYIYSRHNHDFEDGCDCFTSDVVAIDSTSMRISNCCQKGKVNNETQTCNIGVNYARLTNPEKKEARFMYTRAGVTVESHVWIIDVDYESYAIISGCDHVSDEEERETFWILSRDKEFNSMEVQKIDAVLLANNFEKKKIIKQRHGADVCKTTRPQKEHSSGQDKRRP